MPRRDRIPAHYHWAEVPKRDGGARVPRCRTLCSGHPKRRIARVLPRHARVAPCHRLPIRRGVVENARRHVGRPELLAGHFALSTVSAIQVKEAAFPAEIHAEPPRFSSPCFVTTGMYFPRARLPRRGSPIWCCALTRSWGPGAGPGVIYPLLRRPRFLRRLDGVEERARRACRRWASGRGQAGAVPGWPAEAGHRPGGQRAGGRPRLPPRDCGRSCTSAAVGCRGAPEGCRPGGGRRLRRLLGQVDLAPGQPTARRRSIAAGCRPRCG